MGSVELLMKADLIIWDLDSLIDIPYYISNHPIQKGIKNGEIVFGAWLEDMSSSKIRPD